MKKIVAIGLFNDLNQGDPLIHRTVKALYEKYFDEDIIWKDVDLRCSLRGIPNSLWTLIVKKLYAIVTRLSFNSKLKFLFELRIRLLAICLESHFKNYDGVLFVGGGIIHYKFHDYWTTISASLLACKNLSIPIIINSVGVEGFDPNDIKCQLLSKYFRIGSLRYISTRDDIRTLIDCYLNNDNSVIVEKVIDPVIFCSKLFDVDYSKTDVVGIGLLRTTFVDNYRETISISDLQKYYIDLINELEFRGIKWEFFTNGLSIDVDIIPSLESHFNRKFSVYIPQNSDQLMTKIASYRGIITARMHGCIIAYSFDVPAVAYNWCEKVSYWFDNINHPERVILLDKLSGKDAVDKFLEAERGGYESNLRDKLEYDHIEKLKKEFQFF